MIESEAKKIYQPTPAEKQVLETTLLKSAKLINDGAQYPIDSWAREAVHIDSPSTCHPEKCLNCDNRQKRDKMPLEASYYGGQR